MYDGFPKENVTYIHHHNS